MVSPAGHLDFYPNGGVVQPDCKAGDIRCGHHRASKLFVESIRQSCVFIAIQCPSYEKFVQGDCWGCEKNSCSPMGLKAKPLDKKSNNVKLFLMTNGYSPFCGSHYRVSVISSTDNTSWQHGGEFGVVGIDLIGARDYSGEILLSEKSIFYKNGTVYRRVLLATDVGDLLSVKFYFHYQGSLLNPMSWRIRSPTLYISSLVIEQLYPQRRWKFCFNPVKLDANTEYLLTREHLC
ncbi:Endothelial lipase [Armadillidium nasatum]|uniref:Endothelial lipase n=1 Tax=Armadillidium nasatum TaxID=96803 RepID=A0A5N5TAP6_9CRUS|nr:Endothelial lipase [Armadillidium nasatum]